MKLNKSIFIYPFVLAPILAIFSTLFLHNGFYNLLSAITWLGVIFIIFDKLGKHKQIEFPTYLKYLLAFVLYTIISDFLLAHKSINIKYLYSNYILSGFLAALMVENIKVSTTFIKRASFISIMFLFFAFVVIIYQQTINDIFLVNQNSENTISDLKNTSLVEKRLPSIYSWSSLLDLNFGFIGIATLIISKRILDRSKNINTILLIIMALVFSFLTRGRWIMINSLLIVVMFLLFKGITFKNIMVYGLLSGILLTATIKTLEFVNIPVTEIINERILESDKSSIDKTSAGTRILAFYVFGKLFPEHPIFGKGMIHSFGGHSRDVELVKELGGRSSQLHVGYLSLLYYYGIVGALPFLLFLYTLIKKLYNEAKLTNFFGGFFVFLGFALANASLVNFPIFYYGLILALVYHNYYYDEYKFEQNNLNIAAIND